MKFVVLVWSYATVYPMLTPVVLFPIFFLFAQIFRDALESVNSAMVFFIAVMVVGGATYINITEGPDRYATFLAQRGVETDATVSALQGNDVTLKFQGAAGESEIVTYAPKKRRFYPPIEEPIVPPDNGGTVRIAYYPGVETGLIVLSDHRKSVYGNKIACNEAKRVLKLAENAFRFEQFPGAEKRAAYRSAIDSVNAMNCLDASERDRYNEVIKKL